MWEGALAPFEGEGGAPPAPLPGSLPYQHAACFLLLALCVRLLVRRLRHRHRALLAADCVSLSGHRAAATPPLSGWRAVSERCGRASTRLRALARSFVAPAELADAVLTLAEQLEAREAQVVSSRDTGGGPAEISPSSSRRGRRRWYLAEIQAEVQPRYRRAARGARGAGGALQFSPLQATSSVHRGGH